MLLFHIICASCLQEGTQSSAAYSFEFISTHVLEALTYNTRFYELGALDILEFKATV